ncbi:hypothetical protein D9757_011182 [Collybiopsis confluens]|uniref:Uncharacterized protein n=1 Tax=Collybiopsis confluens TaxID=2823264 RepID=A0A8H5H361_9AGAR|nr:hypothetical protein D9757_013161 [Collybiopsis confluens]KAF5375827.1 hypothetical protein D9757_011182 [Collybiopsis confluens]
MSISLSRPAVLLLTTIFTYLGLCPVPAHAGVATSPGPGDNTSPGGRISGPDENGICYQGSPYGAITPCPKSVYPHLSAAAVAGIIIAAVFVIVLLIALILWRQQVQNVSDDSASSLFDFVPATRRPWKSTFKSDSDNGAGGGRRPSWRWPFQLSSPTPPTVHQNPAKLSKPRPAIRVILNESPKKLEAIEELEETKDGMSSVESLA